MPSLKLLAPATIEDRSLHVYYIENFTGDRAEFRGILQQLLKDNKQLAPDLLLDVSVRPDLPQNSISLSHCKDAGLIGWVAKPSRIGVDVEQVCRIRAHIIERVSSSKEISEAPKQEFLWSAKEAAFKSHSDTVEVISSVEVFDWQSRQRDVWSFKARLHEKETTLLGTGELRLIEGHTAAFFLANH